MRTPRMVLKYMWYMLQVTSYLLSKNYTDAVTPQNYNTALAAWAKAQETFVKCIIDAGFSIEDLEK